MKYSIVEIMDAFNECAKELEEKDKEIERLQKQLNTIKQILDNQIDYREDRDVIVAIGEVINNEIR